MSKRLGTALQKVAVEGRQEGVVTGGKGDEIVWDEEVNSVSTAEI